MTCAILPSNVAMVDVLGLLRISSPSPSQNLSDLALSIILNGVSYSLDQSQTQAVS
jgi:hypothetical protein